MGKLYAITAGEYSDYHIITLCSDEEKALKIARDKLTEYRARELGI